VKRVLRSALNYTRTRIWEQIGRQDPHVVFAREGIYGLSAFLRETWNPHLTREILREFGANIHPECHPVGPNVTIHEAIEDFSNLTLGRSVHIGREVFLDLTDKLIIEESVGVGMRAILLTHLNVGDGYPNKPMTRLFPKMHKPTILRRGCSIGAGAIIACGVEVGEDALVNAGVVVDRDVPPRTVVSNTRRKADFKIPDRFFDRKKRDDI
jgi:acetyltransferase-like isoleucine patch superfamily enzyme